MKRLYHLLCTFLILISHSLPGQDISRATDHSVYRYYYSITTREAEKICRKGIAAVRDNYFHTLADSVRFEEDLDPQLAPGNYLAVWAEKDELKFSYIPVMNTFPAILNNSADLIIYLTDSTGTMVSDARLSVDGKLIRFDPASGTYRDRHSNLQGVLSITCGGITTVHLLQRTNNNSAFRRISGKILYSIPVRYVWIPLKLLLRSPYDLGRWIIKGRRSGIWYYLTQPFVSIYRSIAWGQPYGFVATVFSWFDGYYGEASTRGFIAFSKPKYRPEDTLYFKALLLDENNRPICRRRLELTLEESGYYSSDHLHAQIIDTVTSYRSGAFEGRLDLSGFSSLKSGRSYQLTLHSPSDRISLSGTFLYEDYELKSYQFDLKTGSGDHYPGEPVTVKMTAKDNNELPVADARVKLELKPWTGVSKAFVSPLIVREVLWTWEGNFRPDGTLEVSIPDSVFPAANLMTSLNAEFRDASNEAHSLSSDIHHYFLREETALDWQGDSLQFVLKKNGIKTNTAAMVYLQRRGMIVDSFAASLPLVLPANQSLASVNLKVNNVLYPQPLSDLQGNISLQAKRSRDHLKMEVFNPHHLPFRYFLYKNNHEIQRGSGTSYSDSLRTQAPDNYYFCLIYEWADQPVVLNYDLSYDRNSLNITSTLPPVAYPGQELEVKVRVTNDRGEPIKNADITAVSWTGKFDGEIPGFAINTDSKQREMINSFRISETDDNQDSYRLLYDRWSPAFSLDTMDYYRFRYPETGYAVSEAKSEFPGTWFAPYVFDKGRVIPVYHVYIDYVPVYLAEASHTNPYLFRISEGLHTIKIRTADRWIEIYNVRFSYGYRYFLSIDLSRVEEIQKEEEKDKHWDLSNKISVKKMEPFYTPEETRMLKQKMIRVKNNFEQKPAYIRQGGNVYLLTGVKESGLYNNLNLYTVGPMSYESLHFVNPDRLTADLPFAEDYTYEFREGYSDRMKVIACEQGKNRMPWLQPVLILDDRPVYETEILMDWMEYKEKNKSMIFYPSTPSSTVKPNGTVRIINSITSGKQSFRNHLLSGSQAGGFTMIYPGNSADFYSIPGGRYELITVFRDNRYIRTDSFTVVPGGTTYLTYTEGQIRPEDEMSVSFDSLINEICNDHNAEYQSYINDYEINRLKALRESYNQVIPGTGTLITGVVTDKESGEPLPGVCIVIKGTSTGTVSDINGVYQIRAPGNSKLVFSFIGFKTEELDAAVAGGVVSLGAEILCLDEVVVVGYGIRKSSVSAYSIAIVESSGDFSTFLQGKVSGLEISSNYGNTSGLVIRRDSSVNPGNEPLYVIDGRVYNGQPFDLAPELVSSIEVLQGDKAAAIYGSRAANGVVLITTNQGMLNGQVPGDLPGLKELLEFKMTEAHAAPSGLRTHFSDNAIWEPALRTDRNGEAIFSARLPDDITQWKAGFIVYADHKRAATHRTTVKSYKPVSGELSLPRFLLEGDTAFVIGKTRNYTGDTIAGTVSFSLGEEILSAEEKSFAEISVDTACLAAPDGDSISLTYLFKRDDGYFDGEKRSIPLLRRGTMETRGNFISLYGDSTLNWTPEFDTLPVRLKVHTSMIDELLEETGRVDIYPYLCNEQMASKLMALLFRQEILDYRGKYFGQKNAVNKLIRKLEKNQNQEGLWGWWNRNETSGWISLHVLRSLRFARDLGYEVKIDSVGAYNGLTRLRTGSEQYGEKTMLLETMLEFSEDPEILREIETMEKQEFEETSDFIAYQELRLKAGLTADTDSILQLKKETLYGNWYWANSSDR
ncbi:MAG: carboxypeptidase-like regulatory domain-containing protein, partial [Bacteroidota bacterium]